MKKFVKLGAVLAALILALACFTACSNDDGDDDSSSTLNGVWLNKDGDGYKIEGEKAWAVEKIDGTYYLFDSIPTEIPDEMLETFGMPRNLAATIKFDEANGKVTITEPGGEPETVSYKLEGDKLTVDDEELTRSNVSLKPVSSLTLNEFIELDF